MKQAQNQRRPRPRSGPRRSKGTDNTKNDIKVRGNPKQLLEKYKNQAREAQQAGDRIQTEYYLQFADHYQRVINEIRTGPADVMREVDPNAPPKPVTEPDDEAETQHHSREVNREQGRRARGRGRGRTRRDEQQPSEASGMQHGASGRKEAGTAAGSAGGFAGGHDPIETIDPSVLPPAIPLDSEPSPQPELVGAASGDEQPKRRGRGRPPKQSDQSTPAGAAER